MKLYIAGPMGGRPSWNFPAFHTAAKLLREKGFDVYNPAQKESNPDGKPSRCMIPKSWGGLSTIITPESIIRSDFVELLKCRGIVALPGWMQSTGAKAEVLVAQRSGLLMLKLEDTMLCEIKPDLMVGV